MNESNRPSGLRTNFYEKAKLGAAEAPEGIGAELDATVERSIDEAFVSAYRTVMLAATAMALASAVSAGLLIEGKKPKERAEEKASVEVLTT